jgi:hypothetical protein
MPGRSFHATVSCVDRETFARRFHAAAADTREFARQFLEEELPETLRFRLRLNSSYDGNPLHSDETVYPEDSAPERARTLRDCSAEQVIATLWRGESVPEWINLQIVGVTATSTLVEILSCGRFTSNDRLLYHQPEGRAPFHVLGPSLPMHWAQGQRFSIYHRAHCTSESELDAIRPHASKVWSLELEGDVANDGVLERLPALTRLEILELKDSSLRGPGLTFLERHPRLRVLRGSMSERTELAVVGPLPPTVEVLDLSGLPSRPWGFATAIRGLRALEWLTLQGAGDLHLDEGALPERAGRLTLTASRLMGEPRLPRELDSLSLHLSAESDAHLAAWLGPMERVQHLSLRGTPISDNLVEQLASRWPLASLDVVGTGVSQAVLRRLARANPDLRIFPRADLGDVDAKEVQAIVERQIASGLEFEEFHGITPGNLRSLLALPQPVAVTSDDEQSSRKMMWAILAERPQAPLILFDPSDRGWVVARRTSSGWTQVAWADSLKGALRCTEV